MRTLSADEHGVIQVGTIIDVDEKRAMEFVDGGFAEEIDPRPVKQAKKTNRKTVKKEAE